MKKLKNVSADGKWQIYGNAGYGESDSDIDFHDGEMSYAAIGVYYTSGPYLPKGQNC